jgi:hypothetical protein
MRAATETKTGRRWGAALVYFAIGFVLLKVVEAVYCAERTFSTVLVVLWLLGLAALCRCLRLLFSRAHRAG